MRVARHEDIVVSVDARRRVRVLEALLGAADGQHVDAIAAAQVELFEGESAHLLRRTQLHDGEAVLLHFDVVNHAATHEVRRALACVQVGVDDVVGTHAAQDTAMLGGRRLHPDRGNPHVDEVRGDEHRRLQRGAHADNGAAELARTQLLERILGRRIRLDEGESTREGLHAGGVLFDGKDLVAQLVLRHRDGGAETAQPDDERSRLEFL